MLSLSAGDFQGLWLATSGLLIAPTAAVLVGNGVFSAATGRHGLPVRPLSLPRLVRPPGAVAFSPRLSAPGPWLLLVTFRLPSCNRSLLVEC